MWILPSYVLLRDRFDPAADLQSYHGPIQFLIAGDDEVIGAETGRLLASGYAGPKRVQIEPGAHHNDLTAQPAEWWKQVIDYWQVVAR